MNEEQGPWLTGHAQCRVCQYRWVAVIVADGEVDNMQCPSC